MSSKRYRCEINRDSGWEAVGRAGFEGVRMVAIDADWSALRFRRVEFVKSLTRDPSRAVTKEGKVRAKAHSAAESPSRKADSPAKKRPSESAG